MYKPAGILIVTALALACMTTWANAQGCRTIRNPDGSMSTDCPSSVPPAPSAMQTMMPQTSAPPIPPTSVPVVPGLRFVCVTQAGQCGLPYNPSAQRGMSCNCSGIVGYVD